MAARSRFSIEQIKAILRDCEPGIKVQDICKVHGISTTTFYKWRAKHGEPVSADLRRLQRLEQENQRLKALVADLTLRNEALKGVVSKKW